MPEKTTFWLSAKIDRLVMSPARHVTSRFVLVFLLIVPVSLVNSDDRPVEKPDVSQSPVTHPGNDESAQSRIGPKDIGALITLLDSREFAHREQASHDLAAIGEPVIGPLAYRSFRCSPETGWRIKKTLEQICIGGSEHVFLKAVAILKLRFNVGSSNNPELAQTLAKLESDWRKMRKREAVAKLREAGATVNDPFENIDMQLQRMPVWQDANLIIFTDDLIDSSNNTSKSKTVKQRTAKVKLTEQEVKVQIKTILNSDIEKNRELVFGSSIEKMFSNPEYPEFTPNVAAQFALRNQFRANQLAMGRLQGISSAGVTVELGENWKGLATDYQLLDDIENLREMTFVKQSVTSETFKKLAGIGTLTKLVFDDCEIETTGLSDANWNILSAVELKNQTISTSLIESCASVRSLRSMTFTACKMKDAALDALSNLQVMQFNDIELDDTIFASLADLKHLNYVNLTVCKFETDDYKTLKAARPNLQIAFTAQAFFGVRGPVNMALEGRIRFDQNGQPIAMDDGVSITDVIAGSGAQKAGVKIGDVIESINGQTIEKFEDLRLHIAQHRAGDKLDVTVLRDEKPVKLQVELGSQKDAPRFEP